MSLVIICIYPFFHSAYSYHGHTCAGETKLPPTLDLLLWGVQNEDRLPHFLKLYKHYLASPAVCTPSNRTIFTVPSFMFCLNAVYGLFSHCEYSVLQSIPPSCDCFLNYGDSTFLSVIYFKSEVVQPRPNHDHCNYIYHYEQNVICKTLSNIVLLTLNSAFIFYI